MKQAWSMLDALNPLSGQVVLRDGAWGFESKPDVITLGGWHEQFS